VPGTQQPALTPNPASKFHPAPNTRWTTYLGGDGILCSGVFLIILKLLSLLALCAAGLFDATDASVDRAGSWIDEWLPCRCRVYEATVELEDGRDMSWPMNGSCLSSVIAGGVLRAGRSNTCSIEGLRKQSAAWGLGRIEVASAEAVMNIRTRNALRFSSRCLLLEGVCIWSGAS
jgi:hypothetical protein